MKCFSLFSGIGGFDIAAESLGHEIVGACEIDRYARQIYGKHFPNVPIHEDATKINPETLPDFDILVAGFPCQDLSVAGKGRGFIMLSGNITAKLCNAGIDKEKILQLDEYFEEFPQHYKFANEMSNSIGKYTTNKINNSDDWLERYHYSFLAVSSSSGTLLTNSS